MLEKIFLRLKNVSAKEVELFSENMRIAGIMVENLPQHYEEKSVDWRTALILTDVSDEITQTMKKCGMPVVWVAAEDVTENLELGFLFDYTIQDIGDISASYLNIIMARFNGEPAVIKVTDRLIIREMCVEDLDQLYEVYETLKDCKYVEALYDREEEEAFTRAYIENMYGYYQYGLWLLCLKDSGKIIGRAGIENREIDGESCQEIGYLIHKDYRRQGYVQEAICAIMDYAREYGLESLYVCTHMDNKPSISLALKLGFSLVAEDIEGMNLYYRKL